jgi:hypothetical protein
MFSTAKAMARFRPLVLLTGAVTLVLAGGGVALAVGATGSGTTINGCYDSSTGALRVLTASHDTCGKGEVKISWNEQGPQGLAGKQGPAGPSGVVSMTQLSPKPTGPYSVINFIGKPAEENFSTGMVAEVTGTLDIYSTDGNDTDGTILICDEPVGTSRISYVTYVSYEYPDGSFPATLSGVIKGLSGKYYVGLCGESQSGNQDFGNEEESVVMARESS